MYLGERRAHYKYRQNKQSNSRILIGITSSIFILISVFLGVKGVEYINDSSNSHYYVQAQQSYNNELKKVSLTQTNVAKLFYDDEFFRSEKISVVDKRTYVFEKYFEYNNSPLQGHAHEFVAACDKYGAPKDCISIIAIAKHETNLCKYSISAQMHNCLGWGGGGSNRVSFQSFGQMADRALDVLVNSYGIERMEDPRLMEKVFCGPQDECIGWGSRILNIMDSINNFAEQTGVGKLR